MSKPPSAVRIVDEIEDTGHFKGEVREETLKKVLDLLNEKQISLRPNNPGTARIVGDVTAGAVAGAGLGYILSGSGYIALSCAALAGALAYFLTSYSITITPTGDSEGGAPLFALEIAEV